jgi:hypothetical protein
MADDPDFTLTPVDYDPFAEPDQAQQAREAAATRLQRGMIGQLQPPNPEPPEAYRDWPSFIADRTEAMKPGMMPVERQPGDL